MDKFWYQLADKIIPIFMLLFVIAVVATQQLLRYRRRVLIHKERLVAMEKGLDLPPDLAASSAPDPQACLLRGLLWLFIGAGFFLCLMAVAILLSGDRRVVAMAWAFGGIVPAAIGGAYLLYYRLQGKSS